MHSSTGSASASTILRTADRRSALEAVLSTGAGETPATGEDQASRPELDARLLFAQRSSRVPAAALTPIVHEEVAALMVRAAGL
jgi:hypothetical protein